MKRSTKVTSSRRKQRKAYFTADSNERRVRMSAPLSKELRAKYNIRSLPVRSEDEVRVVVGDHKGHEGKIVNVYRKKYVIHIDKLVANKVNGNTAPIGINASNVVLTKLKLDNRRKTFLEHRAALKSATANKAKISKGEVSADVN